MQSKWLQTHAEHQFAIYKPAYNLKKHTSESLVFTPVMETRAPGSEPNELMDAVAPNLARSETKNLSAYCFGGTEETPVIH